MKKGKLILTLLLLTGILFAAGCVSNTSQAIKIGADEVPSVYAVLGEKKISGTETGTENGIEQTTVTYEAGSITEREAVDYLLELIGSEGFSIQQDAVAQGNGKYYQLMKESETDGKYVIVSLYMEEGAETVLQYKVGGIELL